MPIQSDFYLRTRAVPRPFHIILVEPEIPPNTGNVARLCAATLCPLHLVGKLGFRIDEHAVRRAGLDYWHLVEVMQHATLAEAEQRVASYSPERAPKSWFFSGHARRSYLDADFELATRWSSARKRGSAARAARGARRASDRYPHARSRAFAQLGKLGLDRGVRGFAPKAGTRAGLTRRGSGACAQRTLTAGSA
ncbi:MAG: TrmH family RNA methyltransferase [Pseudomonadota bacterium]